MPFFKMIQEKFISYNNSSLSNGPIICVFNKGLNKEVKTKLYLSLHKNAKIPMNLNGQLTSLENS